MLVVVVVLVTLMTVAFRLGAINDASAQRNTTVSRLQRVENCLSGYYAAFGSYPPVAQHGSYNIYLKVDDHGIQNLDGEENTAIWGWTAIGSTEEKDAWRQVQAACRTQPVGCAFPFPSDYKEYVDAWSDQKKDEAAADTTMSAEDKAIFAAGFDDGVSQNIGRHSRYKNNIDWREIQLFKFGLMSFLLPRYLVMMGSDKSLYTDFAQWKGNNSMPSDPLTGQKYTDWYKVWKDSNESRDTTDYARVANIPSQAVCARWMPNLEGSVHTSRPGLTLFGVKVADSESGGLSVSASEIHSPGGYEQSSTAGQYVLDSCTVRDGWWEDLYYYSPPPYQTYVLWSSGPNKRTFPPWISRESLDAQANRCVGMWIEDDIVNMSH